MPSYGLAAIALVATVGLTTAACAGPPAKKDAKATASGPASASGYPVTLENCGTKQTFTKVPERVVVMNGASVAEVSTLLALGVQDRIVVNQQSYGRSEVPGRAGAITGLPNGGIKPNDAFDISREAMLGQRPDLVLSNTSYGFNAKNGFATRDQLGQVDARSYISPQGCDEDPSRMTLQDSYTLLRDMGKVFGVVDKAEEIVAGLPEADRGDLRQGRGQAEARGHGPLLEHVHGRQRVQRRRRQGHLQRHPRQGRRHQRFRESVRPGVSGHSFARCDWPPLRIKRRLLEGM